MRRRRPPWLARATKAAALVGAQRRRLQPTTKAVELVCPNMRLLAAYCLMGTVAAPRGVPLSSSGPNINAAAMGDVQQPSRMSRWSKEVPSHVQDEEEEAEGIYRYVPGKCINVIFVDDDGSETVCGNECNPAEQLCHDCKHFGHRLF